MGFSLKKSLGGVVGAIGGALLGGPDGAATGYTLGNSLFSGSSNDAKKNYQYQLQNNIALWNMQNAYNTPKEQMARFKEAGLNPNLIYGQTNTASPISTASYDVNNSQDQLNFDNQQKVLSNYMALSNLGIQKDLSSAQVRNIDNSIDMSKLNYGLQKERLNLDRERLALDRDMMDSGFLGNIFGRGNGSRMNDKIVENIENGEIIGRVREAGDNIGNWIGDKVYNVYKWLHTGERNKRWYYF